MHGHGPNPFPLSPGTCARIWEIFLTSRRIVEEIANEFTDVTARQVRHVLRTDLHRPDAATEEALRARFEMTIARPDRLFASPGLLISEIDTLGAIEEHFAITRSEIVRVEAEMAEAQDRQRETGELLPGKWWARRRSERTYLKAVMEALNVQRGKVAKLEKQRAHEALTAPRDRKLLDIVKELDPDLFWRAVAVASERHPEEFKPPRRVKPAEG